jgi:hypothetical protein
MEKAVPTLFSARIRPMELNDFAFVQSLAAEFPLFTVPPDYVLWLFTHFHPEYCRILERDSGERKGYLLAIPTSDPANGIAIWQVAATTPSHAFALEYFAAYLRDLAERKGATSVFFTTTDDSTSLRLIRSLAWQFGNCVLDKRSAVPVGQAEYEFRLSIDKSQSNFS